MARSIRKSLFVALTCLLPLMATGQDYGSGIPMVSIQPAAGGAQSLTVIWDNDFESATCDDTSSGDACALSGATRVNVSLGDEGAAAYSMLLDNGGEYWYGPDTGSFSNSNDLTMDLTINVNVDANDTGVVLCFDETSGSTYNCECTLEYQRSGANHYLRADADGVNGGNITISVSTDYWARLIYEPAGPTCTLHLWSDSYGGTEVGTASTATDTVSSATIQNVHTQWETGNQPTYYVGDVVICEGVPSSPSDDGRCNTL